MTAATGGRCCGTAAQSCALTPYRMAKALVINGVRRFAVDTLALVANQLSYFVL